MTENSFPTKPGSVAILYLTCNDFDAISFASCVAQDWSDSFVYVLDDSSEETAITQIDNAIADHRSNVKLIRRSCKLGAKAGNINHGIQFVSEDYVIICDADQVLPPSFTRRILPKIQQDPKIGYVQGLHKARIDHESVLARLLGEGIFVFWCIVLPIKERFGFPLFLGHGGIIRTELIKTIGFPCVVAEDLAFSVNAYENGYFGRYAEDLISYESFPKDIRAYRKRHMKWVRGTCEFLKHYTFPILKSKHLTMPQKWDIFFALVPVTIGYFFVLFCFGAFASYILPTYVFHDSDSGTCLNKTIFFCLSTDFKLISTLTILAPFLPFGIPLLMLGKPIKFIIFYIFGIAIYVGSIPITFWGMTGFFKDGAADFITTGDDTSDKKFVGFFRNPNHYTMLVAEVFLGVIFLACGIVTDTLAIAALGLVFLVFPILFKFELTRWTIPLAIIGPTLCLIDLFRF